MKILSQNIFWVQIFWAQKNFGQKILIRFFCLKNQVGLTQGGEYMTPPENSRVKIVLDYC